jgi:hypothetical protein
MKFTKVARYGVDSVTVSDNMGDNTKQIEIDYETIAVVQYKNGNIILNILVDILTSVDGSTKMPEEGTETELIAWYKRTYKNVFFWCN